MHEGGTTSTGSDAWNLEISPSYRGERWQIEAGVAASQTRKAGWLGPARALSADIDLGLAPGGLPDLSLETALSVERALAPSSDAADAIDSRLLAALDFSKYLPREAREADAFLRTEARYARRWHARAEPADMALNISGGIAF